MILNLSKTFPLNKLDDFVFGDVEGKHDELLESSICVCRISSINEFLKGKKTIVVGERGAGKTALFRLISDNMLNFRKRKNEEHLIIPIEEELEYKTIKERLISPIQPPIKEDSLYSFIWDVFIIYRILLKLREDFLDSLSDPIKKIINDFEIIFGKEKATFMKLLSSQKVTFGFKIDSSYGGAIPIPNWYASIEPPKDSPSPDKKNIIILELNRYKKEIQSFLQEKKRSCCILIDRLDEFVIKEDYDIQKLTLQGLLDCERSYQTYNKINLKIFLRNDLFNKLDFEKLGYEKVASRKVDLLWTDEDIRRFIAQRIIYNYFQLFKLDSLQLKIAEEKLYIDEKSVDSIEEPQEHIDKNIVKEKIISFVRKIKNKIYELFKSKNMYDIREARHINLNDEISRQLITSIFPKKVKHQSIGGNQETIDIFEFLKTHFCLNMGYTTPRIIVMFIDKCLKHIREYYKNNPDIKVELDENNEYPLIKREWIVKAYSEFKKELWDAYSKSSIKWEQWFNLLRAKKGNKYSFNYADIKKILKADDEIEFNQFLAFLNHIGYVCCKNSNLSHHERSYELPILFR